MNNWTEKHIKGLLFNKKIRSYQAPERKDAGTPTIPQPKSKALIWLEWNLQFLANELSITLASEYKFHGDRKFRFDFCFPSVKVAIEYNGIISDKSRHTTITGYSMDQEKINLAQKEGWVVLSYTPLNYKNAISDLKHIIKNRTNG